MEHLDFRHPIAVVARVAVEKQNRGASVLSWHKPRRDLHVVLGHQRHIVELQPDVRRSQIKGARWKVDQLGLKRAHEHSYANVGADDDREQPT